MKRRMNGTRKRRKRKRKRRTLVLFPWRCAPCCSTLPGPPPSPLKTWLVLIDDSFRSTTWKVYASVIRGFKRSLAALWKLAVISRQETQGDPNVLTTLADEKHRRGAGCGLVEETKIEFGIQSHAGCIRFDIRPSLPWRHRRGWMTSRVVMGFRMQEPRAWIRAVDFSAEVMWARPARRILRGR